MTIGSKSQSNDRENDLDRMEMMEDNGHEEGNMDMKKVISTRMGAAWKQQDMY